MRVRSVLGRQVLQPHLAARHHAVVRVGDRDEPQLLAPAAVDRASTAVTMPAVMARRKSVLLLTPTTLLPPPLACSQVAADTLATLSMIAQ